MPPGCQEGFRNDSKAYGSFLSWFEPSLSSTYCIQPTFHDSSENSPSVTKITYLDLQIGWKNVINMQPYLYHQFSDGLHMHIFVHSMLKCILLGSWSHDTADTHSVACSWTLSYRVYLVIRDALRSWTGQEQKTMTGRGAGGTRDWWEGIAPFLLSCFIISGVCSSCSACEVFSHSPQSTSDAKCLHICTPITAED